MARRPAVAWRLVLVSEMLGSDGPIKGVQISNGSTLTKLPGELVDLIDDLVYANIQRVNMFDECRAIVRSQSCSGRGVRWVIAMLRTSWVLIARTKPIR